MYPFYGLFYDYYYVVLVVPVIIASLIIQAKLKSVYGKYSRINNLRGITGAAAAEIVLHYYNIYDVKVIAAPGDALENAYDPRTNVIRLSEAVYNSSSIAAVGIACHEAGHAAQYAENYVPVKIRTALVPVTNIGSTLSIPLLLIGIFLSLRPLVWVGIGFFAFTTVFQFATLPVEFNASRRALSVIETNGLLSYEEKNGAAKVLKAAALTYVAALALSLAQLLRLILRFTGDRRR